MLTHGQARALVSCVLVAGAIAPRAQSPIQDQLATLGSLDCVFPVYATGTWANGEPLVTNGEPRVEANTSTLSIRFESIDTEDGAAEVASVSSGSFGGQHLNVQVAGISVHFLGVDSSGAVYITTVFFDRNRPRNKVKAVHTRHEFTEVSLPGYTSRPEQYYGECEVGE